MTISDRMNQALNRQITNELGAWHIYLAMSLRFEKMGLRIFAKLFYDQAAEEHAHAMKIIKYLQDVGGTVTLDAIARPRSDYASAQALVEAALESEQVVTQQINDLMTLAESEKDYASRSFLQWFVDEQVEEVSKMVALLQWVKMAGEANLLHVEARIAALGRGE